MTDHLMITTTYMDEFDFIEWPIRNQTHWLNASRYLPYSLANDRSTIDYSSVEVKPFRLENEQDVLAGNG